MDSPGQSHQSAPGVHVPVGSPQTGEGGHQIYPAGVLHLGGVILRVPGLGNKAQFVPQPLDDGPAHEDGALQGVLHLVPEAHGNGGEKAVLAPIQPLAGVHQQEAAGSVGVFGLAGGEAGLAEEGGLLIAGDACDGDLHALEVHRTIDLAAAHYLGQHGHGDVQSGTDALVPA